MIAVITSIELRTPLKFFALSYNALHITRQLKSTPCVVYKATGFWTKHYTLSLWKNAEDMRAFARSGAHLEAMKKSAAMAKEIRTLTVETDGVIPWREAKERLKKEGKKLSFH